MRICAHCSTIWFGNKIGCPHCDFGSYDAIWVYGGFAWAFIAWLKQRPKEIIRWAKNLRTAGQK